MTTESQPPDSPPLPERHTAVTPGPRAARLNELYASSLDRTLAKISWDNFAACYPTVAAQAPAALRTVQKAMVERLDERCRKEYENIVANRAVVPKLNELESVVSDAVRRREERGGDEGGGRPTPPHLLPPSAVAAAHLSPHLVAQQSQLNAKLQTVQSHNAKLFEEINAQRLEMEALLGALERAVADVEGASELLDGVADELARETRAVDTEMAGS